MGGGGGSSKPGSAPVQNDSAQGVESHAPQESVAPDFLKNSIGKGLYNIGFAGPPGCGKSAFLNDVLGTPVAESGSTECTLVPTAYELPLTDPRGYFQKFIERLPKIHQDCVSKKLQSVKLWDLPGAGTRLHPSDTYVQDKGLPFFDFVVVFVGERILEVDHALVSKLIANKVKFFVCRSKLDIVLNSSLKRKKKELKRSLSGQEKLEFAADEMESIRKKMVDEVCQLAPDFHGHLYLLVALDCVDEDEVNFQTVCRLHEAQLAVDRLLLDVIMDRHGHDLRKFFDGSVYGLASKSVFNWLSSAFLAPPQYNQAGSSGSGEEFEQAALSDNDRRDEQALQSTCAVGDGLQQAVNAESESALVHAKSIDDHVKEQEVSPMPLGDSMSAVTSDVKPEDSASQVGVGQMQREQQWNLVHLPDADSAHSVVTERMSDISDSHHSWISVAMENENARCFLPDSLFKTEVGYIPGHDLQKGSRVVAADGINILEVVGIARDKSQSIMDLRTHGACLRVTPNHRVMVPSQSANRSSSDALAKTLQIGNKVLCDDGAIQELTHVRMIDEPTEVLAIAFQPDEAVAVFLAPGAIQTKGVKKEKKRRGGNSKRLANETSNTVLPDISDTDSEIGFPQVEYERAD